MHERQSRRYVRNTDLTGRLVAPDGFEPPTKGL